MKIFSASLLTLGLLFAGPSFAMSVMNNGSQDANLSDLTLHSGLNQTGAAQVVLVSGVTTDNQILTPGQSASFNIDFQNNIINDFQSYTISFTDKKGEHEYFGSNVKKNTPIRPFALFTPDSDIPLFIDVFDSIIPLENLSFDIVNGTNSSLTGYYFSTTWFTFDGNGNRIGDTPYSGSVTSGTSISISLPEPQALVLVIAGLVLLQRQRRNLRARCIAQPAA